MDEKVFQKGRRLQEEFRNRKPLSVVFSEPVAQHTISLSIRQKTIDAFENWLWDNRNELLDAVAFKLELKEMIIDLKTTLDAYVLDVPRATRSMRAIITAMKRKKDEKDRTDQAS